MASVIISQSFQWSLIGEGHFYLNVLLSLPPQHLYKQTHHCPSRLVPSPNLALSTRNLQVMCVILLCIVFCQVCHQILIMAPGLISFSISSIIAQTSTASYLNVSAVSWWSASSILSPPSAILPSAMITLSPVNPCLVMTLDCSRI